MHIPRSGAAERGRRGGVGVFFVRGGQDVGVGGLGGGFGDVVGLEGAILGRGAGGEGFGAEGGGGVVAD